jgi:hypothetical protein
LIRNKGTLILLDILLFLSTLELLTSTPCFEMVLNDESPKAFRLMRERIIVKRTFIIFYS